MKNRKIIISVVCLCLFFVPAVTSSLSETDIDVAPAKLQAALFLKLLVFNKGLAAGGDISMHVIGAPEFASAIQEGIGRHIGNARIGTVTEGDSLPTEKPEVIYIGRCSMTDAVVEYTRANNIMSITGWPDQVEKGVTLGVGVLGAQPRILLNLSSSKAEGIDWNPAVLKVATVIK